MPKYRIPVFWSIGGIVEVEAKSIKEAIEDVGQDEGPIRVQDNCFIDGSFTVDTEGAIDMNRDDEEI